MSKFVWVKAVPAKVVREDGNSLVVMLPNRKKALKISKTQISAAPKFLRLVKKAKFDQDCGCTSVKDLHGLTSESYNVYGKMSKYVESGVKEGSDLSPHMRRKHLHEEGFVRARGREDKTKDLAQKAYESLREGYRVYSVEARKAAKKATKTEAPKAETPAPVAETPVAEVAAV
jgi:hypothetical protein